MQMYRRKFPAKSQLALLDINFPALQGVSKKNEQI
jgi:hypothetical protein